jgi:hypothetical protein
MTKQLQVFFACPNLCICSLLSNDDGCGVGSCTVHAAHLRDGFDSIQAVDLGLAGAVRVSSVDEVGDDAWFHQTVTGRHTPWRLQAAILQCNSFLTCTATTSSCVQL